MLTQRLALDNLEPDKKGGFYHVEDTDFPIPKSSPSCYGGGLHVIH